MKKGLYKTLFRIFSFLSDKTKGAPFFVRYKLLIGTLIIGLAGACTNKSKPVDKRSAEPELPDSMQITCYEAAVMPEDTIDVPDPEIYQPPAITCYDMAVEEDSIEHNGNPENE